MVQNTRMKKMSPKSKQVFFVLSTSNFTLTVWVALHSEFHYVADTVDVRAVHILRQPKSGVPGPPPPPSVSNGQHLAYAPSHSEAILELFKIKSCPKIKRNASICIKIVLFTKIISFFGYVQNNFFPK